MNKKINKNSDTFFDEFVDDRFIPSYKNLVAETHNVISTTNRYFLNNYKMYDDNFSFNEIKKNQIVSGIVSEIKTREFVVNIGYKDMIYIERRSAEDKVCKHLNVGDRVDVLVVDVINNPFVIKGSVSALIKMNVESKLKSFYDNITPIDAIVKEMIPAGYLLDIIIDGISIDAFMPNTLADVNRLPDATVLLGERINVALESLYLDKDKGVYVVSRKKYLNTLIPERIAELKKKPKDTVFTGFVTGTRDFGIFVQFEDFLTGMIHKANIREDYRDKINDIKAGTLIDFYIKDIVKGGTDKIILTQIRGVSLWDTIRVGDTLKGKVNGFKNYGTLIELDYETSGLIQNIYTAKNNKKLSIGEEVEVMVVAITRDERKIYLTYADDKEAIAKFKEKSLDLDKLKEKFNS